MLAYDADFPLDARGTVGATRDVSRTFGKIRRPIGFNTAEAAKRVLTVKSPFGRHGTRFPETYSVVDGCLTVLRGAFDPSDLVVTEEPAPRFPRFFGFVYDEFERIAEEADGLRYDRRTVLSPPDCARRFHERRPRAVRSETLDHGDASRVGKMVERAQAEADAMVIVDGMTYRETSEPLFAVSLGFGSAVPEIEVFCATLDEFRDEGHSIGGYFGLDDPDSAFQCARSVADRLGLPLGTSREDLDGILEKCGSIEMTVDAQAASLRQAVYSMMTRSGKSEKPGQGDSKARPADDGRSAELRSRLKTEWRRSSSVEILSRSKEATADKLEDLVEECVRFDGERETPIFSGPETRLLMDVWTQRSISVRLSLPEASTVALERALFDKRDRQTSG